MPPVIIFNTSTGSDTIASGSQGVIVANGTSASFTGSVVTLDGSPDLSGFVADDDVLWLQTDSGRQFFDIVSVDDGADEVTTVDAPAGTSSGLTWGIGGKRDTFDDSDSRNVFSNFKNSWTIETETDQSISSVIIVDGVSGFSQNILVYIQGSSGSRKIITQTANASHFEKQGTSVGTIGYRRLKLECTNGTKTSANGIDLIDASSTSTVIMRIEDCELGDATNQLNRGVNGGGASDQWGTLEIVDTWIHDCLDRGLSSASFSVCVVNTRGSMFTDNGGSGIHLSANILGDFQDSIFANNGEHGLRKGSGTGKNRFSHCVFFGNTNDGISLVAAFANAYLIFDNNIFKDNGGYGIGGTSASILPPSVLMNFNNCYHNNTSGTVEESDIGEGESVQLVDPQFIDTTNNDFRIGTNLKSKGYPGDIANAGLTTSFQDIGVAQRDELGGGTGINKGHPDHRFSL